MIEVTNNPVPITDEIHLIILNRDVMGTDRAERFVSELRRKVVSLMEEEPYKSENTRALVPVVKRTDEFLHIVKIPDERASMAPKNIYYFVISEELATEARKVLVDMVFGVPLTLFIFRVSHWDAISDLYLAEVVGPIVGGLVEHRSIAVECYRNVLFASKTKKSYPNETSKEDTKMAETKIPQAPDTNDTEQKVQVKPAYDQIYVIPVDNDAHYIEDQVKLFKDALVHIVKTIFTRTSFLRNTDTKIRYGSVVSFMDGITEPSGNNGKNVEHVSYFIVRNSDLARLKVILQTIADVSHVSVHYFHVSSTMHELVYASGLNTDDYCSMMPYEHNVMLCDAYNKIFLRESETDNAGDSDTVHTDDGINKFAFLVGDNILLIRETTGGYDYSFRDTDSLNEIDGGIYDNGDTSIATAINEIVMNHFGNTKLNVQTESRSNLISIPVVASNGILCGREIECSIDGKEINIMHMPITLLDYDTIVNQLKDW